MKQSDTLLRGNAVAFVNFKGGSMKSTLAASISTLASEINQWNTVVVDLDSSAPLTRSVFYRGENRPGADILEALDRVRKQMQVDDLILPAPQLGNKVYVLPGYGDGAIPPMVIDGEEYPGGYERFIPELIAELKECFVGGEPVDLVIVDCPGENALVNESVLRGIDFVAMPASFTATDITASKRTIEVIRRIQRVNKGAPVFLGFIPIFIYRGTQIDRNVITAGADNLVVDMVLSGMLLPYIPVSQEFRKTFANRSAGGIITVPGYAKNSFAGKRVLALWEAINSPRPNRENYLEELLDYLSVPQEAFANSCLETDDA